jgi:hypothetical protein
MNNNKEDQAQRNGRTLIKTMKELKANVVEPANAS